VDIAADSTAGLATAANQLADGHNVTVDNGAAGAAVNIQDGGNIITVDGTVTANAGTGDFLSVTGHTRNESFKESTAIGGELDDAATTAATEDNVSPVRITSQRALHVHLRRGSGEIGTTGNPLGVQISDGVDTASVSGSGRLVTDGSQVTQPISAATLPLPAGAATSANQLADGHNVTVDNAAGASAVNIQDGGNDISVDNAGTFAVQDSQKVADNAGFTDGTTPVQPAGFIYDEVAGTALTENDIAAARLNLNRAQVGVIEDGATRGRWATVSAGNALLTDASATTQPVSGTVTANAGTGSFNNDSVAAEGGSVTNGVLIQGDDGADRQNVSVNGATGAVRAEAPTGGGGDWNLKPSHTRNEAFKESAAIGGELDDTGTTAATEGNISPVRVTAQRAFHANLRNNAGTEIGDATTPVEVSLANTASNATAVTVDASALDIRALTNADIVTAEQATATSLKAEVVGPTADNAANPTAKLSVLAGVANAAAPTRTESNVVPLRTNLAGDVAVTLDGEVPAVTISSGTVTAVTDITNSVTVDQATHNSLQCNANIQVADTDVAVGNPVPVAGTAAEGVAAAGNPVQIGGVDGGNLMRPLELRTQGDGAAGVLGVATENQNRVWNGSTWDRQPGTTTGTFVQGNRNIAQDTAATASPLLSGGTHETIADSAPANRVDTDGDANRLSTTDGALFVIPSGPQQWDYHLNTSTAQTDTQVHASPGAGLSLYVTDIVFSSGAATAINIFFEEATTTVLGPYYLEAVAGRGMSVHFGTPKKITAATALTLTTSASIAHSVDITGFIAPG
jgi:hypothetical protein